MPRITTSATGQVRSEPNKAVVRFSVVEERDAANNARIALAEQVETLRSAIEDLQIAPDRMRATHYKLKERSPRHADEEESPTYRAQQQFTVELDDLSVAGELIDTATANGANRVEGVEHTFTEEKRRDLRNAALEDAMEAARQQASVLAEEGGLTITGVETVETNGINVSSRQTAGRGRQRAIGAGTGTEIDTGPLRVKANVTVTYASTA